MEQVFVVKWTCLGVLRELETTDINEASFHLRDISGYEGVVAWMEVQHREIPPVEPKAELSKEEIKETLDYARELSKEPFFLTPEMRERITQNVLEQMKLK